MGKLSWLTKEEFRFFKWKDEHFFKKCEIRHLVSLRRRIASSLHGLAVVKLGYQPNGYPVGKIIDINKEEAIVHFLKAYEYDSTLPKFTAFRKEVDFFGRIG